MTIDKSNAQIINTKAIYLHDNVLLDFNFNRISKKMNLKLQNNEKIYCTKFINVIGFSMTSCDFWGVSQCIFDFEYIEMENQVLITELRKKNEKIPNSLSKVQYENFIETLFTFSSGDTLRIACERIEFL